MNTSGLGGTLQSKRVNAALAWALVVFVALVAVANVGRDLLWAVFALAVASLALVPPVVVRSPRAMLPWEVLALAALPLLARTFGTPGTGQIATYLAVAAVALIVAVELHVFTPVEMDYSFAVLFVVVTTMAAAGVWAVVRWSADLYLGIDFGLRERELMVEFVASTAAGLLAGVIFEFYFRRMARIQEQQEVVS